MRLSATMHKADWRATVSRAVGILVLLAGVLLAARLCVATPHLNKPVCSTLDSQTQRELEVRR